MLLFFINQECTFTLIILKSYIGFYIGVLWNQGWDFTWMDFRNKCQLLHRCQSENRHLYTICILFPHLLPYTHTPCPQEMSVGYCIIICHSEVGEGFPGVLPTLHSALCLLLLLLSVSILHILCISPAILCSGVWGISRWNTLNSYKMIVQVWAMSKNTGSFWVLSINIF